MNLVQFFGGVSSNKSNNDDLNSLSNSEKSANVKAGTSTLSSKTTAETIGLAVFKGDKLVGELSRCWNCLLFIVKK